MKSSFSISFATPIMFFTGKGGVGKTSAACATAVHLAERGKRVLLVSTDPASNLDTVLGTKLLGSPTPVDGLDGLWALNINPEAAARAYRERVVGPMRDVLPTESIASIEEQLSGACSVEIAAFDEFTSLMTRTSEGLEYDHVVFDTAPTGHTLRLLQLPAAWTVFLETNERGSSCLGPLSGLKNQQEQYAKALELLRDHNRTTLVLVTGPDQSAIAEVKRTRDELLQQGVSNHFLIINGVFKTTDPSDQVAQAMERLGREAIETMPPDLREVPFIEVPLKPHNVVGREALASFFDPPSDAATATPEPESEQIDINGFGRLGELADEVAQSGHGLVMFMGKGGVGKTTMAAALAVELASRGLTVHLTTTDPAAHLDDAVQGSVENLRISRIDPLAETEAYRRRVVERARDQLDEEGLALLEEDLRSPCTEEVAVFHAFSSRVFSARREIVIMDTAPTGHSLLLLDATGSYHREMVRQSSGAKTSVATPLMRLQDPSHTRVIIVALAETTPIQEAAHLQEDLRRAEIEPYAWIINRSMAATRSNDSVLRARAAEEIRQIRIVTESLAGRLFVVPWSSERPTGIRGLRSLLASSEETPPTSGRN